MNPEEVALLLRYSITEGNMIAIKLIFGHYVDKHECPEPDSTSVLIMNEVILVVSYRYAKILRVICDKKILKTFISK